MKGYVKSRRWSLRFLLAASATLACSTGAGAAETVTLVFNEARVSIPLSDFETFARTGETQRENLQGIVARLPRTTEAVRTILTREVAITRPFLENDRGWLMDFLLFQLNSVLASVTLSDNLQPLKTALRKSYKDDQRISLLELIGNYPEPEIVVQLPRLEQAYNRVSELMEQVRPQMETATQFLHRLVCDCPGDSTPASGEKQVEAVEPVPIATTKQCP